ncbi:MAG: nitroreductase family protein [Solirubrobacterales bacterium]|nr:nitroreductase family protein [Solirubrobacterales bacterium]
MSEPWAEKGKAGLPLKVWMIDESDFPSTGSVAGRIRFLLGYAILAPSGHNTQPWLFRIEGDSAELRADRSRALPVVDAEDRELLISCGAALETLLIAAAHFGLRTDVSVLPEPDEEDLLARIIFHEDGRPEEAESRLFDAITKRHTNRQAFEDRELPDGLVDELRAVAAAAGAGLHEITGGERSEVAGLVAEGDRIQMADRSFRRELAAWIHPNRSRNGDGMRGYGFGFNDLMSYAGPLVIRSFDLGKGQAAKDQELAQASPLLAVLWTAAEDPAAWVATGRALQRILLAAGATGVSASFLNQPIEVAEIRGRLARAIGRPDGFPQLLLRLGFGPEVKPEPRRPVADVLSE